MGFKQQERELVIPIECLLRL